MSLTPAGRKLREKGPDGRLIEATGLGEDFAKVRQAVVKLRDNLLRAAKGEDQAKGTRA